MPRAIVLATLGNKKADISTFLYYDKASDKTFMANVLNPWSPYTGRVSVRKNMEKKVLSSERISEKLHPLCECPTCHANITINTVAAQDKKLRKNLFCTLCGTDLHNVGLSNLDDDMTLVPTNEDEAIDTDTIGADDELHPIVNEDIDTVTTQHGEDEDSTTDLVAVKRSKQSLLSASEKKKLKKVKAKKHDKHDKHKNSEDKDKNKAAKANKEKNPSREDAPLTQRKKTPKIDVPIAENPANSAPSTFEAITGEPVNASVKNDTITFNFASNVNWNKADISIVPINNDKSYLIANEMPVMVLSAADANETVKPLFTQPTKLLEAIASMLDTNTFDAKHFGGVEITAKVPLSKTLARQQRKEAKKLQAKTNEALSKLNDRYFKALSIAAVAVNKNTVDKYPNTLKASIIKAMQDNGVRRPEKIVDTIFASEEGANYLRNILAYANEFQKKPHSAQKEIAKFVASASSNSTIVDDDDDDDNDIANHLSDASFSVASVSMNRKNEVEEPFKVSSSINQNDVEYFASVLRK